MTLAERTSLSDLLAHKVCIKSPPIKSDSANPGPKLVSLIAGMCAGAECIDDVDMLRKRRNKDPVRWVCALDDRNLLREFTFGVTCDQIPEVNSVRIGWVGLAV